jgi:hypothetical protein
MDQQAAVSASLAKSRHRPPHGAAGPPAREIRKMVNTSSFKIAAGMFGIAALAKISVFAIAVAMLGISGAQAGSFGKPCTSAPQNQWLSLKTLGSKVEETGFKVQKAKLNNGCADFYVTAKTGARMELFVDPATGTIVSGR